MVKKKKTPISHQSSVNTEQIEVIVYTDFYVLANTLSMLRLHSMEWTLDEMSDIKHEMSRCQRRMHG
jgi:rRNA maturation endonuclease Nob1